MTGAPSPTGGRRKIFSSQVRSDARSNTIRWPASAAQDDLVYVAGFADREALTFGVGHPVLFCCVLDQDTPLPRATVESLGGYLSATGTTPDWIVVFGGLRRE